MRKKNFKGRCEKRSLDKFTTICKTYDPIQYVYADILVKNKDVAQVRCNVILDGDECGEYMTDFVCAKIDGDLMVRECCPQKFLTKPQTAALLDLSRNYWLRHGVTDWGVVVDGSNILLHKTLILQRQNSYADSTNFSLDEVLQTACTLPQRWR